MARISPQQRRRDRSGLRHVCAACGTDGTRTDLLVIDRESGSRIHASHYTDPRSGFHHGRRRSARRGGR